MDMDDHHVLRGKVDSARKIVTIETRLSRSELLGIDERPAVVLPEDHPAFRAFDPKYDELLRRFPDYLATQMEELYRTYYKMGDPDG